MVNHLKDLQELAHSLNKVGAFSDDAVKRADARARAQELRGKMWKVQAMTGADIKEMRDRLGLSQAFLAEIVNMSVESVSKWERGEKKPNGAALRTLNTLDRNGLSAFAEQADK
ncbi:Helix-turn-helix DNA-binding domain protein [Erwinia billingiae Eb661]|jgi:putative transcriptional regulator|uniref:Helix-turn-helix DNA-binding domain protein n=1 Tax=Erwinia billingiae (strain Eb661) TaxID=634500 RepID=D8MNJ6_ERWBE|nr:transcriptional regulator [Erwinia billingiae]CAX58403.1 Helix-turn-helix DNA-binding domain protein [Erwinia billingiae Eb661]